MAKRGRKPKNQNVVPKKEYETFFSDRTLIDVNGFYLKTKNLIESEFPFPDIWNIKTDLTIISNFGETNFELDFREDGSIYIVKYIGSMNIFNRYELGCLSEWSREKGWKLPEPTELLCKSNLQFWKSAWESFLINSKYLEERFGSRSVTDTDSFDEDDLE